MPKNPIRGWFSRCLLAIFPLLAYGETFVGGPVEGTWTASESPYYVDSTIVINQDATLFIEPGVTVLFSKDDSIKVFGTLIAQGDGDNNDSIFFKDIDKATWRGIWFFCGSSDNSILEYVSIRQPLWGVVAHYCQPTIRHSTIRAQSVAVWGYYSDFTLVHSAVEAEALQVAAIRLHESSPYIYDCSISASNNSSIYNVIGIRNVKSNPQIEACTINVDGEGVAYGIFLEDSEKALMLYNLIQVASKNLAYGAFLNRSASPSFINNTVVVESDNYSDKCIYLWQGSSPLIENSILYGDESSQGIVATPGCCPTIVYNDIYNHYQYISGCVEGQGNIFADPLFVDPGGNDFHLTKLSPCIDAGNPLSPLDPDGTRADMGCFYYDQGVSGLVNSKNDAFPWSCNQLNVFPNPFNASSHIQISIPTTQQGLLAVYNQQGSLVSVIESGLFSAGVSQYSWDASGCASGVYYAVLRIPEVTLVKQLVVVK